MASIRGTCSELDCMICVRSERPISIDVKPKGTFVKVLAIIEVKRNPDDIGEAFAGYQQSLSWLSGIKQAYDPEVWKTKAYPNGHFNKPFMQDFYGETLIFTSESFEFIKPRQIKVNKNIYFTELQRNYENNNNINNDKNNNNDDSNNYNDNDDDKNNNDNDVYLFLDCLYFVTKDGIVDCMNSKCTAWTINKIAGEEQFDEYLTDINAVEKLRLRAIDRYAHRLSTIDICKLYQQCSNVNGIYVIGYEKDTDSNDDKYDDSNSNIQVE